ncbi:MAG: thymidine kinase [Candidatus Neomarinimicrobiota bacterium]|nr:thymidine kinase [Candidatus Neomarinimicrobiota bacterium]
MLTPSPKESGWIEVICGSMFSGKTEELIRRLRRAQIARQSVGIFKPKVDSRFSHDHIVSHSELRMASEIVESADEILDSSVEHNVVGIDEAQFFDGSLLGVCSTLADQNMRVIVAGLDKDFRGQPFGPMPELLAEAEYITKTLAICVVCGNPANYSQRLGREKDQVVIGETDKYEARCRKCYEPPGD